MKPTTAASYAKNTRPRECPYLVRRRDLPEDARGTLAALVLSQRWRCAPNYGMRMKPFSTAEVVAMTGASERQLGYWVRVGYLPPHLKGVGSGGRRSWTRADVERARQLKDASDLRRTPLPEMVS